MSFYHYKNVPVYKELLKKSCFMYREILPMNMNAHITYVLITHIALIPVPPYVV